MHKLRFQFKYSGRISVREAFRVTLAVTKVDSLLRVASILAKIEIARSHVVTFALKPSQVGFDMYWFGWYEREVQENSVARE